MKKIASLSVAILMSAALFANAQAQEATAKKIESAVSEEIAETKVEVVKDVTNAVAANTKKDIVDTAKAVGGFDTLLLAIETADLVETLKSEGPFTLYAPTDAAFAKLPEGEIKRLLMRENREELIAVLTYHLVDGRLSSSEVRGGIAEIESLHGRYLTLDGTDIVKVNGVEVVVPDIDTSNGLIHIVDQVLFAPKR